MIPVQDIPASAQNREPTEAKSDTTSVYYSNEDETKEPRQIVFASSFKPRNPEANTKLHSAKVAFLDNLPLQDLRFYPQHAAFLLGTICYVVMIAILLGFLLSTYYQTLKEQFISLDRDAGRCSEVEKPVTGLYAASVEGTWEGTKKFALSTAIYEVEFSSYSGTESRFYDDMMNFYNNRIVKLGEAAKSKTLSDNLVAMMGFAGTFDTSLDGVEHSHVFSFTATPAVVFDKDYSIGTICSSTSCCGNDSLPEISFEGFTQKMSFDHDIYSSDSSCMKVDSPIHLGYQEFYDRGKFEIDIDMTSVTIALAINLKYLEVPGILEAIPNVFDVTTADYTPAAYVDPRFKGMDPIHCFLPKEERPDLDPICWILLAHDSDTQDPVYALPLINEYGGSACECSGSPPPRCNDHDLLAGLLYFKADNWDTGYAHIFTLSAKYSGSFGDLNDDARNAMYYASGSPSQASADLNASFDFCRSAGGIACNILAINTYDLDPKYVSEDYFQIENGNCQDIMTIPNFKRLARTPPTALTEQYYKCFPYSWNAFFSALGIAVGNMSAFAPIVLLIMIPLLASSLFKCIGVETPKEDYTDGEKNAAAKEFALHLLKIKDDRHDALKKNSVLHSLGQELKEISEEYEKTNMIVEMKIRESASSLKYKGVSSPAADLSA